MSKQQQQQQNYSTRSIFIKRKKLRLKGISSKL